MKSSTTTRTSSSSPPLWSWRLAFLTALFPLFSGLAFLIAPETASSLWGFPHATSTSSKHYLALVGVRDLYLAGGVLLFWLRCEQRVVGWLLLLGSAVPVADGFVALWEAAPMWQVLQHWAATVMAASVGYNLVA